MTTSTEIHLARRPHGRPEQDDFRAVHAELPALADGEVRVENAFVSVDPYMRGKMNEGRSYTQPYALDEAMTGAAIGRVVESRSDDHPVGAAVVSQLGWRDVAQGPASEFRVVPELPGGLPLSLHLHILGMTGFTAYVGLRDVARLAEGDTVFVSGAAGAVGSAVGQIARKLGASRVIGSAGGPEKVAALTGRYGFDAGIDYRAAPIREQLGEVAADGVDVYFDNVGGDHLEAALDVMNDHGRVALCGAISAYNSTERAPGPDNLANIVTRRLQLTGFIVGEHVQAAYADFQRDMTAWLADGSIVWDETVVAGIDNAVTAFQDLLEGGNTGKMLVRIGE